MGSQNQQNHTEVHYICRHRKRFSYSFLFASPFLGFSVTKFIFCYKFNRSLFLQSVICEVPIFPKNTRCLVNKNEIFFMCVNPEIFFMCVNPSSLPIFYSSVAKSLLQVLKEDYWKVMRNFLKSSS
jgi:hypothetical protein